MEQKTIIYVGNLPHKLMSHEGISQFFIPFGEIKSIDLPSNLLDQGAKNYALVEYEDPQDCEHAIFNMNDSEIGGKQIQCHFAKLGQINKVRGQKPIWQTDEYQRTVAEEDAQQEGLEKID